MDGVVGAHTVLVPVRPISKPMTLNSTGPTTRGGFSSFLKVPGGSGKLTIRLLRDPKSPSTLAHLRGQIHSLLPLNSVCRGYYPERRTDREGQALVFDIRLSKRKA